MDNKQAQCEEKAWYRVTMLRAMIVRIHINNNNIRAAEEECDRCLRAAVHSCNARCKWDKHADVLRKMGGFAKRALAEAYAVRRQMDEARYLQSLKGGEAI